MSLRDLVRTEKLDLKPVGTGKNGAMSGTFPNGQRVLVKYVQEKNASGGTVQRGFPISSLGGRAVAFYRLARYLGEPYLKLVTETILDEVQGKPALIQVWADAFPLKKIDPRLKQRKHPEWIEAFRKAVARVEVQDLRSAVVLDCIGASRDRHANNFGLSLRLNDHGVSWLLRLWDNDCAFGLTWEKYHNVLHKYRFTQAIDLSDQFGTLEAISLDSLAEVLDGCISPEEIEHTYKRVRFMLDFPYRLPFAVFTKGQYDPNKFPKYEEYFK